MVSCFSLGAPAGLSAAGAAAAPGAGATRMKGALASAPASDATYAGCTPGAAAPVASAGLAGCEGGGSAPPLTPAATPAACASARHACTTRQGLAQPASCLSYFHVAAMSL